MSLSFWFPCFVFEIFQYLWYANYTYSMTYRRMLYIFAIMNRNHFKVIMCVCFSHHTKHVHFEVISFYNSKETEISQKRSKGIKNWKITYSVILSVLSNKTNLILEFSSPSTIYMKKFFQFCLADSMQCNFNNFCN